MPGRACRRCSRALASPRATPALSVQAGGSGRCPGAADESVVPRAAGGLRSAGSSPECSDRAVVASPSPGPYPPWRSPGPARASPPTPSLSKTARASGRLPARSARAFSRPAVGIEKGLFMSRSTTPCPESLSQAGWLLGPILTWHCGTDDDDEGLAQARELAAAAAVDVAGVALDGLPSRSLSEAIATTGAGLVVIPASLLGSPEGQHRVREALATACPVLVARPRPAGAVMVVADPPRAGLRAMCVAADEAHRLDRCLVVAHGGEDRSRAANDALATETDGNLETCVSTIQSRFGIDVATVALVGPWGPSLVELARQSRTRLLVVGADDSQGVASRSAKQALMEVARLAPCPLLLVPAPRARSYGSAEGRDVPALATSCRDDSTPPMPTRRKGH